MARDSFVRLSFGPGDDQAAVWTPDSKRLTFRRGSISNIFWLPVDGSVPDERLTTSENVQRPCSWSTDGRLLVYQEVQAETGTDLFLLSLAGERFSRPFLQTSFDESAAVVSPDGRFVAYVSNESGRDEVYVRPFPGLGGKWQVSTGGGSQAVWARSGREIFYRNGEEMMAVPIDTEPEFRAGKPVFLFELSLHASAGAGRFPQYDVAADGERFVMIEEEPQRQIHVIQNWFEELKARVPVR